MGKKIFLLFMAITLVAGLGVTSGCFGVKRGVAEVVAIDLVPQTANFAASVNLSRILADEDVRDAINGITASLEEPKTVNELLDLAKEETGVDFRNFSEVLIFGDFGNKDYLGAIEKGKFDQAALLTSIGNAVGEQLSATDYRGYQLYTSPSNKAAICFLTGDTLIGGSTAVVKDAIDVKEGAPSLDEPTYDTYKAMGDAWVKIALGVPAETTGEIAEGVPLALKFLQNMEAIGFSFNKVGDNLSFQLKLLFLDSASAGDAKGMFDIIKGMLALAPDVPGEVAEIVNRLNVVQSESWVTLSFEATKAEIQAWAHALAPALQPGLEKVVP
jgi:hypothetical protein